VPEPVDLEVELPRANVAPLLARWVLSTFIADRIDASMLTRAELLVSELATIALLRGQEQIKLRATLDEDRLLVEVIDDGCEPAGDLGRTRYDQFGGFARDLVEHISSRWGMHETTPHIWFELERCEPRAQSAQALP
jgi:anti-sigma regulatory factor (Ser/Thr protein kinase)